MKARWLPILAALVLGSAAAAEPGGWRLTDDTLEPREVRAVSIAGDALSAKLPDGSSLTVPMEQFVELVRTDLASARPGVLVVLLHDGQRVVGKPAGLDADRLIVDSSSGTFPIPLASVAAIVRTGDGPLSDVAPAPEEDVALLANGDRIGGILESADADHALMAVGGQSVPIPWASIAVLRFAATSAPRPLEPPAFRIGLNDGSVLLSPQLGSAAGGDLTAVVLGTPVQLPLDRVVRLNHLAGPVAWVADRSPTLAYTPALGESFPPRWTGDHDALVRSRTLIEVPLEPADDRFVCGYALDGDRPLADAVLRVRLDGRVALQQPITGRTPPGRIDLALGGATSLGLEIDYGGGLATQDAVRWIAPAIVRTPPTPIP